MATQSGEKPTCPIDPTPPVPAAVMSAAETLPLKSPDMGPDAWVGIEIVSAKARLAEDEFVRLTDPLSVAESALLAAEKL